MNICTQSYIDKIIYCGKHYSFHGLFSLIGVVARAKDRYKGTGR